MTKMHSAPELIAAGRRDFYGPVHKGLRLRHAQMLQRLGQADFAGDIAPLLADLRAHLHMAVVHLVDEEVHIHHRLESRLAGGSHALEDQHANHRRHVARLHDEIRRIESDPGRGMRSGHPLYLAFSRFVADDLEHMAYEEEVAWPMLCSVFSDEELAMIESEIVAGLAPELSVAFTTAMLAGVNPAERQAMLVGMRAGMEPRAYAAFLQAVVRPTLDAPTLQALAAAGLLP